MTLPVDRFETNNSFSTLNPAYTSNLQASLSIPLLRTAGLFYNTQQIRIAFYEYQATQAQTKLEVTRVLADLEKVYWRLYAARQELVVRQKQRDLAVAQLERARRQVNAQVAAEVEITRAEWDELYPGRVPTVLLEIPAAEETEVYWANITHNLGAMARDSTHAAGRRRFGNPH